MDAINWFEHMDLDKECKMIFKSSYCSFQDIAKELKESSTQ